MALKKKRVSKQEPATTCDLSFSKQKMEKVRQHTNMRRKGDSLLRKTDVIAVVHAEDRPKTALLFRRKEDMESLKSLTDSELIEVILTQNREAYQELFDRYQRKLFVYVFHLVGNKDEADDIIQNVFTKTYKNIEHFDVTRKFSSWIYRIAHNEAVNFLKRRNKRYTISWEDVSSSKDKLDMASNEELPEEIWEHQEVTKEIREALDKLPEKYKEILSLRYFSEYSYDQIGKLLHKPVNTVGTLINRAKRKLFDVMQQHGQRR